MSTRKITWLIQIQICYSQLSLERRIKSLRKKKTWETYSKMTARKLKERRSINHWEIHTPILSFTKTTKNMLKTILRDSESNLSSRADLILINTKIWRTIKSKSNSRQMRKRDKQKKTKKSGGNLRQPSSMTTWEALWSQTLSILVQKPW